jgi:malonyl-CoA/methylmalonyl-CoA synthetase
VLTQAYQWPDPSKRLTLEKVRRDLRGRLSSYKLPTLLRVVQDLPKTATGKVSKKILGPQLFPKEGHRDIQAWSNTKAAMVSKL